MFDTTVECDTEALIIRRLVLFYTLDCIKEVIRLSQHHSKKNMYS